MADISTFDLFEFVQGATHPEKNVQVYTDARGVFDLSVLENQIADEVDPDKADALISQAEEIKTQIRATSLTFHMRGVPTPILKDVADKADAKFGTGDLPDEDEAKKNSYVNSLLVSLNIRKVTKADGAEDTRTWEPEDVERLFEALPSGQPGKLIAAAMELSVQSRAFEDYEVTPDFS